MNDAHAPSGYVRGRVLGTGRAFVTFEIVAGDATFVCKRVRLAAIESAVARRQLEREARVLERLTAKGSPKLLLADADDRGPFLVMERVPGEPLVSLGRDDLAAAAGSGFEALALVHEAGVVHGDLNPSNVLLSADRGRAWLVDFALARTEEELHTAADTFAGTIAFASPELARGEKIDARCDLFAMSASLLSAAIGREPRPRDPTIAAQLARAGEEPLDDFVRAASGVVTEPALLRVLEACVAFDAGQRPASARAVLALLRAC